MNILGHFLTVGALGRHRLDATHTILFYSRSERSEMLSRQIASRETPRAVPILPRAMNESPPMVFSTGPSLLTVSGFAPLLSADLLGEHFASVFSQMEELRESHSVLSTELCKVRQDLQASRTSAETARLSAHLRSSLLNEKLLRRILLFSKLAAEKALHAGTSESRLVCRSGSQSSTVKQSLLKSPPTSCTLHEFHLLVQAAVSSKTVRCRVLPSAYYASFPSVREISCLQIVFNSYFDLCEFLGIEVAQREHGLYKERKTSSRRLRALQILGVDYIREYNGRKQDRAILIGSGVPPRSSTARIPILFQSNLLWGEDQWDTGFLLRSAHSDFFCNPCISSAQNDEDGKDRQVRTSNMNIEASRDSFSLCWEKDLDGCSPNDRNAELVPGALRSLFPAVVLRSETLTRSAQAIFSTSLEDNTFLKELVVSPPSQELHGVTPI